MPQRKGKKQEFRKVASERAVQSAMQMATKEGSINIFARVEKSLGDRRFQITLSHKRGQPAIAKLRGVLKGKAVRIETNDFVVVAQREGDKTERYDICGKLDAKDVRQLRREGLLGHLEEESAFEFEAADPIGGDGVAPSDAAEEDSATDTESEPDIDTI